MRLLVVSPIASHPQNQGNSARIYSLCKSFQSLGHLVHFLYYRMEGLTPAQSTEMTACWDDFHSLPARQVIKRPRAGQGYGLDDWYDSSVGALARRLHGLWQFDAVLVNYVWMSGVLDELPSNLPKIIDTHDVFGDRHRSFGDQGLVPEWYYTTREDERRGLLRADIVVAIQADEGVYFRNLLDAADTKVTVVGHGRPQCFLPAHRPSPRPVVGYLGSANPFNVASIRRFAAELDDAPELIKRFHFVLAGTICDRFATPPGAFESLGRLADLEDFYAAVDIVINPMLGGTGLKIKTLEGLSYGLPVLGTEDAWVGIGNWQRVLPEAPSFNVVEGLRVIAADLLLIGRMRERCRTAFTTYLHNELGAIRRLLELISDEQR